MSLNHDELVRTSAELHANLNLTGLNRAEVASDLGVAAQQLDAALSPTGSDPVLVWQLRDYLLHAVRDAGGAPVPFSVLTDANKLRARLWFSLRKAPRHDFST